MKTFSAIRKQLLLFNLQEITVKFHFRTLINEIQFIHNVHMQAYEKITPDQKIKSSFSFRSVI